MAGDWVVVLLAAPDYGSDGTTHARTLADTALGKLGNMYRGLA